VYEHTAGLVYDLLNTARGKDYAGEAEAMSAIFAGAHSVLDVGCGTGRHLAELRARGLEVTRVDVSPEMLAVARARLGPDVRLELGDLRTFDLGATFEAVMCWNGTIGYLTTVADLQAGFRRLAAHVATGGVLVVEPWFTPDQWMAPMVTAESGKEGDVAACRVSRAYLDDDGLGVFEWHGSVATPERAWSFVETHRLGLHTIDTYLAAMSAAGLVAEHRPLDVGRRLGVLVGRPGAAWSSGDATGSGKTA
jgi:SAM-dependent methyltransferase